MPTTTVTETQTQEPLASKPAVVVQPPGQVNIPKSTIDSSDRRRDWALYVLTGGGMAMTLYAAAALYIVQHYAHYAYWLGMAAMANILVLFTGIAGLLVKRTLSI